MHKKSGMWAFRAVGAKWWQTGWFTGGNVNSAPQCSFTPSSSCNSVTFNKMSRITITNTSGNKAVAVEKSFEPVSMLLCCRCAGIYSPYCTRFVWYESFLSLQWSLAYSRCFFQGGGELQACFSFTVNTLISPYTWHFKEFFRWTLEKCAACCALGSPSLSKYDYAFSGSPGIWLRDYSSSCFSKSDINFTPSASASRIKLYPVHLSRTRESSISSHWC